MNDGGAFLFLLCFSFLYFKGLFNEGIIPVALDNQLGAMRLVGYLSSHI